MAKRKYLVTVKASKSNSETRWWLCDGVGCNGSWRCGKSRVCGNHDGKFSYLNILKENLKASATNLGIQDDYRFLHDNDPKHTSMVVREWLLYNVKEVVPHPPQSPDLNPIEHLWGILDKKIRQHKITNKQMLKDVIVQEWQNIGAETTEKLALSMKNRLRDVAAKGYHTKY